MQILNKKAPMNYEILERIEAGISLSGSEVKAIKTRRVDLSNSYVKIINNEVFLINANIHLNQGVSNRSRKLLLHKSQIISLATKVKAKKLTLIPLRLYTKDDLIKLEIGLARSKRKFEKIKELKLKQIEEEARKELKEILKYKN